MKEIRFIYFTGVFVALVSGNRVDGQLAITKLPGSSELVFFKQKSSENSSGFIKKNAVNQTVKRNFLQSLKDFSDEKWFEVRDGFVVMFKLDGTDYQVAYGKKGTWLHTIRSYVESKMPEEVRHIVNSTYYDYNINMTWEIKRPLVPVLYIIQLLGKSEIVNLSICDGDMVVLQRLDQSRDLTSE